MYNYNLIALAFCDVDLVVNDRSNVEAFCFYTCHFVIISDQSVIYLLCNLVTLQHILSL